jgi:hypothetical protein
MISNDYCSRWRESEYVKELFSASLCGLPEHTSALSAGCDSGRDALALAKVASTWLV